ncbi:MAG: hypothetical protein IT207_11690 [Fimbriimonadaceae bacterium]|nr:hypothetical protein [Fimbriimonadaceae bacterium]
MSRDGWVSRVALLWAGVLLGCSFIATPAKFRAPSLSLPTALEVGRVTFRSLAVAEVALAVVGCALLLRLGPRRSWFWLAIGLLIVQWIVVMPLLNAQTDTVVQGGVRSGPPWHVVYIALEAVKVVTLFIVALQTSPEQASPA